MKKKSKIKKLDQLIKTFNILIKQCYRKSRFVKEQEVSRFLRSLGIKTL